eukprot:scaffold1341_cov178-Amphora_coffeaeformis.AAC.10
MSLVLPQKNEEEEEEDYCREYLPPEVVEKLEAGAFRQLCHHLQERSDSVANIDLMTLSGFCRNCLAKWMVLEARKVSETTDTTTTTRQALNALGYEEAAQHVYGMTYGTWKKRHQKKATDEQMARYQASEPLQAKHDKALLATRGEKPQTKVQPRTATSSVGDSGGGLMSNVCCQDVEEVVAKATKNQTETKQGRTTVGPYQPPPVPTLEKPVRVAILTISDRAAAGRYATGDLSGPAVEAAVQQILLPQLCEIVPKVIVPDDKVTIQTQLRAWSKEAPEAVVDIILTTGGTGMAARDVTPEATREILDTECAGLMAFVTTQCSRLQPLASLTRGTAGILGRSLVANLPGNPKGVGEIMPILLPLLLHAHQDIRDG